IRGFADSRRGKSRAPGLRRAPYLHELGRVRAKLLAPVDCGEGRRFTIGAESEDDCRVRRNRASLGLVDPLRLVPCSRPSKGCAKRLGIGPEGGKAQVPVDPPFVWEDPARNHNRLNNRRARPKGISWSRWSLYALPVNTKSSSRSGTAIRNCPPLP